LVVSNWNEQSLIEELPGIIAVGIYIIWMIVFVVTSAHIFYKAMRDED